MGNGRDSKTSHEADEVKQNLRLKGREYSSELQQNGSKHCQRLGLRTIKNCQSSLCVPKQTIGIRGTVVRIQTNKVLELTD